MKLRISLLVLCACITAMLSAQSYSVKYDDGSTVRWVHISIDTNFSPEAITVEKIFSPTPVDTVLDHNMLLLLGNFIWDKDTVVLDYERFNYYWVAFKPEIPFYHWNKTIRTTIAQAKLRFGAGPKQQQIGDRVFTCVCAMPGQNTVNPVGCQIEIDKSAGVIYCLSEDSFCDDTCNGSVLDVMQNRLPGGSAGIIIQVVKEKVHLYHNFATGGSR